MIVTFQQLQQAHTIDLTLRLNGQNVHFQADWLKEVPGLKQFLEAKSMGGTTALEESITEPVILELFEYIKHGDAKHQAWLKERLLEFAKELAAKQPPIPKLASSEKIASDMRAFVWRTIYGDAVPVPVGDTVVITPDQYRKFLENLGIKVEHDFSKD